MSCSKGCLTRRLSLIIGVMLVGCAAMPRESQLTITPGAPRPVAAHIGTYQEAVDAIVSVMTEDLQIPLPRTSFTMYFYPYQEAFAQGLTEQFKTDPALARELARSALGRIRQTKEGKRLLVNEEMLEYLSWPGRIHVLAHELTHVAQYELAQGQLAGDLWVIEGFADWAAYRVLQALGLDTFHRRKQQKIAQLRHASEPPLLALSQMATAQDWDALSTRYGSAIPYAQAFLAADLLIEQHGVSAVLAYFRCMSHLSNRLENFQAAFGEELLAFEPKFIAYQEQLHEGSWPNSAIPASLPN